MSNQLQQIATVHSPFKEKFGIPRQAGLIPAATGFIELLPPYNDPEALRGLGGFSHVWLIWLANAVSRDSWKPTVRPPRLGGNERIGVFASRSIFRPNPVGQSLVKLEQVITGKARCGLMVSGLDILDGSPVLDIKPYLPWADSVTDAIGGFAHSAPADRIDVTISDSAVPVFEQLQKENSRVAELIKQVISHDPRPAFHQAGRSYGVRIENLEVGFRVEGLTAWIDSIVEIASTAAKRDERTIFSDKVV